MNTNSVLQKSKWTLLSIFFISIAQLSMKWGMLNLTQRWPELSPILAQNEIISFLSIAYNPLLVVCLGIICYAVSMIFWIVGLKFLPVSVATPLVSISYVLVLIGAVNLPWFNETFDWRQGAGIGFILIGLICIFKGRTDSTTTQNSD